MYSVPEFKKKQLVIVFARNGDKLSFSNDNVVVKDKDGKIKHQSTCYKLFLLIIVGDTSITTGLLKRAKKFGFSICLMTYSFKVYEMLNNLGEGNTLLRNKQYEYKDVKLGQQLIKNKILVQRDALLKKRNRSTDDNMVITSLKKYSRDVLNVYSINEIMGIEGTSAKKYFERIFDNVDWKGRIPRIKPDYINSTLDIGYTLLFNFVDAITNSFGFDTYQGILHRCFYMRKSLVCDLVEPFRPLIDLQVRKSINLGQIKKDDFEIFNGKYVLKYKENGKYTKFLLEPIIAKKDEIFSYIQKYYRAFMKGLEPDKFPEFRL